MAAKASDDLAAFAEARRERMRPASKCKVCWLPAEIVADLHRGREQYGLSFAALAEYAGQKGHVGLDQNKVHYHFSECGRRARGAA